MEILKVCPSCKKRKWILKYHRIRLPINLTVKSVKNICKKCANELQLQVIKGVHNENDTTRS